DNTGSAQLTSANYVIDRTTAHSCLVTATTSTGGANISVLVVPNTPIRAWIGATSNSWQTASNWASNALPSAGDSVWIPQSVFFSPRLTSATTVSGLRFEDAAVSTLDLASFG